MSSTAFQSVTPIIPRLVGVGYSAFSLDADQLIDGGGEVATFSLTSSALNYCVAPQTIISSSPSGINITTGDDPQTASFPVGSIVTLTSTVASFSSWTGDTQGQDTSSLTIQLTMTEDLVVNGQYFCS